MTILKFLLVDKWEPINQIHRLLPWLCSSGYFLSTYKCLVYVCCWGIVDISPICVCYPFFKDDKYNLLCLIYKQGVNLTTKRVLFIYDILYTPYVLAYV